MHKTRRPSSRSNNFVFLSFGAASRCGRSYWPTVNCPSSGSAVFDETIAAPKYLRKQRRKGFCICTHFENVHDFTLCLAGMLSKFVRFYLKDNARTVHYSCRTCHYRIPRRCKANNRKLRNFNHLHFVSNFRKKASFIIAFQWEKIALEIL